MKEKPTPPEIVLTHRHLYELLRDGELHYRPPGHVGWSLSLVEATYQLDDSTLAEDFWRQAKAEDRRQRRVWAADRRARAKEQKQAGMTT